MPHFNPEQLAAMSPDQRQKYEAMVKSRQAAANTQMNDIMTRLRAIGQEQHQAAANEQLPDILMTPEQYREIAQKIQAMVGEMSKISKILGKWYLVTQDDERAVLFFKMVSLQ
jgi:hypothetical protein